MRYFSDSAVAPTLEELVDGLREIDDKYELQDGGQLVHDSVLVACLEVCRLGEDVFDEELEEFVEAVAEGTGPGKSDIAELLDRAHWSVVVQVVFGDRETEDVLVRIDPIWAWLKKRYWGATQADGEGFYLEGTLAVQC